MKKLLLLGLAVVLFNSCEKQEKRYTQQSPEIETVKKAIQNYNDKNYDLALYADSSKTYFNSNSKDKFMTPAETVAYHKANDENYSSRGFTDNEPEYEMVVTDEGNTWVNCWLEWKATLAGNGKEITMPVHLTYKFVDGKIVRQVGYWDPTEVVMNLQEIEAEKNMPVEEKTMKSLIDTCVKAWNDNDKNLMASIMTNDFIRTENGAVIAKSSAEYGTNLMDVFHGSFPDFKVILDDYKIVGNTIHINWTCKGTNTKPFQGNPATNKPIITHGHSIWTVGSEGKLTREDAFYDNLTLFNQLGYMPALK
jgi:hypothetical protein